MNFVGIVRFRSSSPSSDGPPGESKVQQRNPRRERLVLQATGWAALSPGSLNLEVEKETTHSLLAYEPLVVEDTSSLSYPSGWEHIPKLRQGYVYYAGSVCRTDYEDAQEVVVRRAFNVTGIEQRLELLAPRELKEHFQLSDGDTLDVTILAARRPEVSGGVQEIDGVLTTKRYETWRELLTARDTYQLSNARWVFRGQRLARWHIESTFERAKSGNDAYAAWEYEAVVLREFTRRAHHFSSDLPPAHDVLEWFALMRHYTAPCRLVDFTYSFYSAAYFALKDAADEPAAIWAVNTDWLRKRYEATWDVSDRDFRFKNPAKFRKRFLNTSNPKQFVAPANAFRVKPIPS